MDSLSLTIKTPNTAPSPQSCRAASRRWRCNKLSSPQSCRAASRRRRCNKLPSPQSCRAASRRRRCTAWPQPSSAWRQCSWRRSWARWWTLRCAAPAPLVGGGLAFGCLYDGYFLDRHNQRATSKFRSINGRKMYSFVFRSDFFLSWYEKFQCT